MTSLQRALELLDPPAELRVLFEEDLRTTREVCARNELSRRTIGRRLRAAGVPPIKRWVGFTRILRAHDVLQGGVSTAALIAAKLYPDPFTFSAQLARVLGVRTREFRSLTVEQIVAKWHTRNLQRAA